MYVFIYTFVYSQCWIDNSKTPLRGFPQIGEKKNNRPEI